jgi:ketosteroid isomerase-like protein
LHWNEAENSLNAAGNPYRSFDEVLEGVFRPTMRDFDGFRCEVEKLLVAGETIVGTGRYRGKHRETGKQLSAQFCHLLRFDGNAKLDRVQEYTDTLQEAEIAGRVQIAPEMRIPNPVY